MSVYDLMERSAERVTHTLRALRYKNFRLFIAGQTISLIGTWMQATALGWLVYELTESKVLLGVVGFASQIPSFFLAPIAGVFADRMNKRKLLMLTQVSAMVQALTLAALVLTGVVGSPGTWQGVWYIVGLSMFLGLINACDVPIRQSFVVEMVDRKRDLGNAIALNSMMFNSARLIGPSLGGLILAASSAGVCFLINGISYVAVLAALASMRIRPKKTVRKRGPVLEELREGFTYVRSHAPIRSVLINIALVSLVGAPYALLLPVFASDILHAGPRAYGLMVGAVGMGAFLGALYLASRRSARGVARMIPVATAVLGIGMICFSLSSVFWLSLPLLLFTGFGWMVQMASSNTAVQTLVADDKRGRVMSFYAVSFMGVMPFGNLLGGSLAETGLGAPGTVLLGGACCILGALAFVRKVPAVNELIRRSHDAHEAAEAADETPVPDPDGQTR